MELIQSGGLQLSLSAATQVGPKGENRDAYCICQKSGLLAQAQGAARQSFARRLPHAPAQQLTLAVADGVTNVPDGARAAAVAMHTLVAQVAQGGAPKDWAAAVNAAVVAACYDPATQQTRGAATLAFLTLDQTGGITVANVGDSPVFRLRNGVLEQLSTDHTLAAALGSKHPTEAQRNTLLRYLGDPHAEEPQADIVVQSELRAGDCYLICSDGVSNTLGRDRLQELLAGNRPLQARELVQLAAPDGQDDMTALLLQVHAPSLLRRMWDRARAICSGAAKRRA